MTLRISEHLLDRIRREAELAYPAECCGVIAGSGTTLKAACRVVPVANRRTDDPHRYLIGPEDLRAAERELLPDGLEIVGYYHSHPDHPPTPSAFDTEHAWPWYSYLIVEVRGGRAERLEAWELDPERLHMNPESMLVESEV
jgi:proteasome lid subunit RPN8/RPN11